MIKVGLKNFFKNLIYVFIPMGIFYLFVLVTIFWLAGAVVQALGGMLSDLFELISISVDESSVSVNEFLAYSFDQLDKSNGLFNVIVQILSTSWLKDTCIGFFETLDSGVSNFGENCTAIIAEFTSALKAYISIAVAILVAGILLANYATRYAIRRRTAKRTFKKYLVAQIVLPLGQSAIVVASAVACFFLKYYGLLLILAFVAISSSVSLLTSWLVYGKGVIPVKEVVTWRNIFSHLASGALILLIFAAFTVAVFLLSPLLAVLLAVPVALYALTVADMNTDAFVSSLAEKKKS